MCLRQSYERREITEIKWISSGTNPADAMTKSKPCLALKHLVDTNKLDLQVTEWVKRDQQILAQTSRWSDVYGQTYGPGFVLWIRICLGTTLRTRLKLEYVLRTGLRTWGIIRPLLRQAQCVIKRKQRSKQRVNKGHKGQAYHGLPWTTMDEDSISFGPWKPTGFHGRWFCLLRPLRPLLWGHVYQNSFTTPDQKNQKSPSTAYRPPHRQGALCRWYRLTQPEKYHSAQ